MIDRDRDIHRMTRRISELERKLLGAAAARQKQASATTVSSITCVHSSKSAGKKNKP
jgi:hypothetical protein